MKSKMKVDLSIKRVRPDAKGRITLGDLAKGVSGFDVFQDASGKIILEPYAEIPANEKWLFENKTALKKAIQGLEDHAKGQLSKRGSFAQFMDEEDD